MRHAQFLWLNTGAHMRHARFLWLNHSPVFLVAMLFLAVDDASSHMAPCAGSDIVITSNVTSFSVDAGSYCSTNYLQLRGGTPAVGLVSHWDYTNMCLRVCMCVCLRIVLCRLSKLFMGSNVRLGAPSRPGAPCSLTLIPALLPLLFSSLPCHRIRSFSPHFSPFLRPYCTSLCSTTSFRCYLHPRFSAIPPTCLTPFTLVSYSLALLSFIASLPCIPPSALLLFASPPLIHRLATVQLSADSRLVQE